ncbi:MAG: PAS domain-containing sensor histidine kinase [Anaerolineaceae bacterium]|nr:PAS domain-containing sensor histidine kinase [Anaerolineaceae bacterium]
MKTKQMETNKTAHKPFEPEIHLTEAQAALLHHRLTEAANTLSAGWGGVFAYTTQAQALILTLDTSVDLADRVNALVRRQIRDNALSSDDMALDAAVLQDTGFTTGRLVGVPTDNGLTGLIVLLGNADAGFTGAATLLAPLVDLVRIILENVQLRARIAAAQAIQAVAQTVTQNPTSQDLLDALQRELFNPQVVQAALLLYGQAGTPRPDDGFDFVEIQGTWSRRFGSSIARGIKIYLSPYKSLLEKLDRDGIVTLSGLKALRNGIDPFFQGFLWAEGVRSITLIALNSAGRKFGLLVLGSRVRDGFAPQELANYRIVSEFLSLNTLTRALQYENDLEFRARNALLDAVADGIVMVMPSRQDHYVLGVNQAFREMFDLLSSPLEGVPLTALLDQMRIPVVVREALRDQWMQIPPRDLARYKGEFDMTRNSVPGTIQWYSAPVNRENEVSGRIFAFHDVSPERAASRLRANFISRVSHELRTPLTSIQGFADFILQATGADLPPLAREYTEIILSSARHLNTMFSEIIDLARADVGEMKLNPIEFHLPDVIIDVVALLEMQYKARNQQVMMELNDDVPEIRADMNRIRQVLTNLVSNAIKYSPPDTSIKVLMQVAESAGELPADAPPDVVTPALLVTVADQGPGFAPDEAEKLFMPFYRTASARASRTEGSGLGLAVSRSIVEAHGGKIWAEARRRGRRGSRFHFTLPTTG